MTKQLLAVLVTAILFSVSCKEDEICAKCELKEYCVICTYSDGTQVEGCGTEDDTDSFRGDCLLAGGAAVTSNSVDDTRELCDEDDQVVNSFMDARVDNGYKCEYTN